MMQKITLQSDLAKTFSGLDQKVLICDESGKELGLFQPAMKTTIECPLSIEETEKRRARYIPGTGRTTEEVLKKWES